MEKILGEILFEGIKGDNPYETNNVFTGVVAPFLHTEGVKVIVTSDNLSTGLYIGKENYTPLFQIIKTTFEIRQNYLQKTITLKTLQKTTPLPGEKYILWRSGFSLAVITLSDKGFLGQRIDESGPIIEEILKKTLPISLTYRSMIPDDFYTLKGLLNDLIFVDKIDLIVTTGGTGVTDRDITPDVMESLIEKRLWGFEHAMFREGLKKTPNAIISRAVCGIAHSSLIINLPGSKKAVQENLMAILPALNHTLEKIKNDPTDCATN